MKGYRQFLFGIFAVLIIYVLAELDQPKPLDWTMTLSKDDKNPLGGFILYQQLAYFFPGRRIDSYHLPVYDQLNAGKVKNTAYFLIDPVLNLSSNDYEELFNYAASGNYVFIAGSDFPGGLMDTLHLKTSNRFGWVEADSSFVNFTNPLLRSKNDFIFHSPYFEEYFTSLDTVHTIVLGSTNRNEVNFVKIPVGEGAFFIHSSPVCFSNYFLLKNNNSEYTAKALSYIPAGISRIYWDEYYKQGPSESLSPFRFLLSNRYLRLAFWMVLFSLLSYVWFGAKRKQRIIPVIEPLRNSTLDFVETVGKLYFNQHDNRNIAVKKINYFLEFVRTNFYLSTSSLNPAFRDALAKKSSLPKQEIEDLIGVIQAVEQSQPVGDSLLLELNKKIDNFYVNAK